MVADSDGFNPQAIVRSARTAVVAGMEPGRTQARLRQLRERQLLDLHPGPSTGARQLVRASAASTADRRFHPMAGNWR